MDITKMENMQDMLVYGLLQLVARMRAEQHLPIVEGIRKLVEAPAIYTSASAYTMTQAALDEALQIIKNNQATVLTRQARMDRNK